MSKLDSILSTRNIAFAAYIEHVAREGGHPLTTWQRELLYKAAEEFHKSGAGTAFHKSLSECFVAASK